MPQFLNKTNPYDFVYMEKWVSNDKSYTGYVGVCKDGDVFLTWDSKDDVPTFSGGCKIGVTVTNENYDMFRGMYASYEGKHIERLNKCDYQILGFNRVYTFQRPTYSVPLVKKHKFSLSNILKLI